MRDLQHNRVRRRAAEEVEQEVLAALQVLVVVEGRTLEDEQRLGPGAGLPVTGPQVELLLIYKILQIQLTLIHYRIISI